MNPIDELQFLQPLTRLPYASAALAVVALLLAAALANWLTRRVLLRLVGAWSTRSQQGPDGGGVRQHPVTAAP